MSEIHIHVHIEPDATDPDIATILNIVQNLQEKEVIMALDITELEAKVTQNTDVAQSAVTLIQGLAAAFEAAQGDPAAIAALVASLSASADSLGAAVVAGTDVLNPPPVEPPVEPV